MAFDPSDKFGLQPYREPEGPAPRGSPGPPADDHVPSIARERLTTLFGVEVGERRRWPWFAILLIGVAGLAAAASVWLPLEFFLSACLGPLTFGVIIWATRPPPLRMAFSEAGITFSPSGYFLPYEQILEVFAPERDGRLRFRILLLCEQGYLTLPAKLDTDSEGLFEFLVSQPLGRRSIPADVDPMFHAFLRQQTAVHGADAITIYQRPAWDERQRIRTSWRDNEWLRMFLAFLATGAILLAGFAIRRREAAAFMIFVALGLWGTSLIIMIFGLVRFLNRGGPRKLKDSMLIVTPSGLALSQGDLKGELRWREISKLALQKNHIGAAGTAAGPGVLIHVAGASLIIADIYHWPAEHIHWLLRKQSGL